MATNYSFTFRCIDNGGKRQSLTIKASNKAQAIDKGLQRAKKKAAGDITNWECVLNPTF